jgi:photosystem II stability/assembly factor-like uncharacterized protein
MKIPGLLRLQHLAIFLLAGLHHMAAQPLFRETPTGTPASLRAVSAPGSGVIWLAGSGGTILRSVSEGESWKLRAIPGFEKRDFRSLYAFDSLHALVACTGSPAVILQTTDGGQNWQEVYRNTHPDAFLDGMDFWDQNRGMVYGDPLDGRFLLLVTNDGGRTWIPVPEEQRPAADSGEASFAASGTAIRLWDNQKAAIATGGRISRIWYSEDGGQKWTCRPVPILQGAASQGIFSLAVRGKNWVVTGGDFARDTLRRNHVFYSEDEGKTWHFPRLPTRGYRESVEWTESGGLLATGPGGTDFSGDGGKTWEPVADQAGFHVVRLARRGQALVMAGGKGRAAVASGKKPARKK